MTDWTEEETYEWLDRRIEATARARKLRHDRPWAYDILRVVLPSRSGLRLQEIYRFVRDMRDPTGLPQPEEFEATVRSVIYQHSSGSPKWSGHQDDALFFSPRRGIWCAHGAMAKQWLSQHEAEIFN